MKRSPAAMMQRRQGYGAITSGLSSASDSLSDSTGKATSSLSQTQIVGVVVAIIVLAILAIGSTWYCCVRQAKRRDARNAKEEEEIRERERQASVQSNIHGSVTVGMPAATSSGMYGGGGGGNAHSPFERRGSDQDEDYWKREPLMPADTMGGGGSGGGGYIGSGYVVDFDEMGQPRYHNHQSPHPSQLPPPGYHHSSAALHSPNAYERQPMYIR